VSPIVTREQAQAAEATARRAEADAEQATQEAAARRLAAEQAARDAEEQQKEWERTEQGWKLNAGNEFQALKKRADAVLAAKPDRERPPVEARILARRVLRGVLPEQEFAVLERLGRLDPIFASLAGVQDEVQRFASRAGELRDDALNNAADDLEVRCHRAVLARLRFLAGEAEG
jgi:hypothetical protein